MIDSYILGGREGEETTQRIYILREQLKVIKKELGSPLTLMIDSYILGRREGEETTQRIYPERTAQDDQERTRLPSHL